MLAVARQASRKVAEQAARGFRSSAVAKGGHGEPDYVHAKSMYNITSMTNRKLKFGLGVGGVVVLGCAIPWIACEIQFARARG